MRRLFLFLMSRPAFANVFSTLRKLANLGQNYNAAARYTVRRSGEYIALSTIARQIGQTDEFVLCDIGASHGDYTEIALALLPERTTIFCFEPTERNCAVLRKRFAAQPRVNVVACGLADLPGTTLIHYPWEGGNAAIDLETMQEMIDVPMSQESITLDTLDSWIAKNKVTRVDMLKIDVEGFELKVLQGSAKAIETLGIRFIQFEFGVGSMIQRTYFRDFWSLLNGKYRFHLVLNRGLLEITEYDLDWENYQTANFLLILRECA